MKKLLALFVLGAAVNGFAGDWVRTDKGNWRQIVDGQYYTVCNGVKYYQWDGYGRPIMARRSSEPTSYTRSNYGSSNSTTNNYGSANYTLNNYSSSNGTINNYGDSNLTVNNYGRGRTTVNDYGSGSRTTVRRSNDELMSETEATLQRLERKLGLR